MCDENSAIKPKIVIVSTELDYGGVETSVLDRAVALQEKGFILEFICLHKLGKVGKKLQSLGFKVYCLETSPKIQNLKNIFQLTRLLREIKPEIVHTICIEANFHGVLAATFAGVKKIVSEEVGISISKNVGVIRSWQARQLSKFVWKRANSILAISQAVKEYLIMFENASAAKIEVIPHFVSQDFLQNGQKNRSESQSEIIIGCVARISPEKGQIILLEAFKIALSKCQLLRLWFIGDGPDRCKLQASVENLGLGDYVSFWGFREDVVSLLKEIDIFALPSLTEGLGIAVLEAMSLGIPVIASKVGGIPEIIRHRKNGVMIPAGDKEAFANEILRMVNLDESEREKMTLEAQKTVRNKFSRTVVTEKLSKLYLTLAKENKSE